MAIYCGQESRVNHGAAGRCALPRWCDKWDCAACRVHKQKRVMEEIAAGDPNLFLTITWRVRPGWTPEAAAQALRAAWAKWAALHNRRRGRRDLQYYAVPEPTDAGWPHIHLAVRCKWVSLRKLRAFLAAEIDSPVVKLVKLDGVHRVAAYLAKYMSKGPTRFGTMKRYWRTLDYLSPEYLEERAARRMPGVWQIDPRSWQEIAFDAVLRGFRVVYLDPGVQIHAKVPP